MTPKEKAEELVEKFAGGLGEKLEMYNSEILIGAKQCALICVDEILATQENAWENNIVGWNKVKQEINKI